MNGCEDLVGPDGAVVGLVAMGVIVFAIVTFVVGCVWVTVKVHDWMGSDNEE